MIEKGYEVHGIRRRVSIFNTERIDSNYFRSSEVETYIGDNTKAVGKLTWKPMVKIDQLIDEMVSADERKAIKESTLIYIDLGETLK